MRQNGLPSAAISLCFPWLAPLFPETAGRPLGKASDHHLRRMRLRSHSQQCILCAERFLLCTLVLYARADPRHDDRLCAGSKGNPVAVRLPYLCHFHGSVCSDLPAAQERRRGKRRLVLLSQLSGALLSGTGGLRSISGAGCPAHSPQKRRKAFLETHRPHHHLRLPDLYHGCSILRRIHTPACQTVCGRGN